MDWPSKVISPDDLLWRARKALQSSYAPYSGFRVGSAILTTDDEIFIGCNVENAVLSLTICAERNAMTSLVQNATGKPVAIAVVCESGHECPPCGSCRQFLFEFNPDMLVVLESSGQISTKTLRDLLPSPFMTTPEGSFPE
ncbi:MAG: cytidine deaminase [Synergistales bacterium]|nr:cytidine deaminase [Synergistales bacterium]